MGLFDYAPDPGFTVAPTPSPDQTIADNPIWNDNVSAQPDQVPDQSVDVPGRKQAQSWFSSWFGGFSEGSGGTTYPRDGYAKPPVRVATKDAGAETQTGILGRFWNAITNPFQTIEDAGAAAGGAAGKGVANLLEPVLKVITPLIIIFLVTLVVGLWIVSQRTTIKANV